MKLLEGKVALITGASRGIGKAIALKFASEGADIAYTDLKVNDETTAEIAALGVKVIAYSSNAADFADSHATVEKVLADFGRIDILVNNAGITRDGLMLRMDEAQWDSVINVNLKSAYNFIHAVTPVMAKQRGGSIINMSSVVGVSGGIVTVNSINDAVTVFKLLGTDDNVTKVINVAAGEYYEKVEIDIPKVELVGGTTNAADTVIWYDLIAAIVAPGTNQGYSTDGAATVSIRESATGFHAQNITFRNYYNTYELYLQSQELAAKTDGNTQAVACLVDADMCVFDNVIFTGYHDTLYARYGRQVYNYCHIEGRTDYVFGYSATAYFNECTFKTLGADGGNNGGYVAATRGCKTGAADAVEYGYVFYKCYFIADTNVVEGTVSLARAWGEYMTLAFIECDISSAYSLSAYGEGVDGKNVRYEEMSGVVPDPERIFEYGNTGAGAAMRDRVKWIETLSPAKAGQLSNPDYIYKMCKEWIVE